MILERIFHSFLNECLISRTVEFYIAIVEILQAASCELLATGAARMRKMRLTRKNTQTMQRIVITIIFDKWN